MSKVEPQSNPPKSIEQNVRARKAAESIMDLGVTMAKDEQLDAEHVREFWTIVIKSASDLIGIELERKSKANNKPARKRKDRPKAVRVAEPPDDDDPFPFGKPKEEGLTYGEVDDAYYEWISRQDWREKWPAVVAYIEFHGLDG